MAGEQRRASNGVGEIAGIGNWPPDISSVFEAPSTDRFVLTGRHDGLASIVILTTPGGNEIGINNASGSRTHHVCAEMPTINPVRASA